MEEKGYWLGAEGQVGRRQEELSEEETQQEHSGSERVKSHIEDVSSFLCLLTSGAALFLEENG